MLPHNSQWLKQTSTVYTGRVRVLKTAARMNAYICDKASYGKMQCNSVSLERLHID